MNIKFCVIQLNNIIILVYWIGIKMIALTLSELNTPLLLNQGVGHVFYEILFMQINS